MLLKRTIIVFLTTFLLTNSFMLQVFAQPPSGSDPNRDTAVVISVGRPNIWSLEQAHYLLARMHHTNRNIQANPLSDLNANEINANQIRLLRQILGISADFAQVKKPKSGEEEESETETAENNAELDVSLPESAIDLPENAFSDPKLNASTVLDNYINLQYEIIARQLTLLRDEVGPGERLIFLELPHSVFTTDRKADKRLVQVWWQIEGFSKMEKDAVDCETDEECKKSGGQRNERPRSVSKIILDAEQAKLATNKIKSLGDEGKIKFESLENNKNVRTVDLIPRQSSLILNKTYDSVSGLNLFGAFSWLFGLGVKGNYQRQKEVFEQYLHQEVYASSFGKGETDFGWTFAPTPGTKRLNPGLRTTYAVVIVPRDAETISLNAKGCFFKQSKNQPYSYAATNNDVWRRQNSDDRFCELQKNFTIPIPNGGDHRGFYISDIRYLAGQKPGGRIVVSVKGENFSPQVGVMINGVSLRQSVGIAQPFLDKINSQDTTYKEQDGISGEVEYIDSDEIVFAFRMPDSFKGTPTIHLIAPGRAIYLNRLPNVRVNSNRKGTPLAEAERMFGNPFPNNFTIEDFKVFPTSNTNQFIGLLIGNNFDSYSQVFVNGQNRNIIARILDKQIRFEFTAGSTEDIVATVINGRTGNAESDSVAYRRLSPFSLNQVTALSFKNDVMIVKIDGTGLSGLKIIKLDGADVNESTVIPNGANQAFLRIGKPKEIVEVLLENSSGQTARSVIVRP